MKGWLLLMHQVLQPVAGLLLATVVCRFVCKQELWVQDRRFAEAGLHFFCEPCVRVAPRPIGLLPLAMS